MVIIKLFRLWIAILCGLVTIFNTHVSILFYVSYYSAQYVIFFIFYELLIENCSNEVLVACEITQIRKMIHFDYAKHAENI